MTSSGASGPREVMQFGPSRPPPSRRQWAAFVVAAVLIGSVVVWAVARDGSRESNVAPVPSAPTQTTVESGRVGVSTAGTPNPLGVPDDWELFGRGPDELVRIELASGRVTRTTVPALRSSGPVSFVVGSDRVVVRPLDFVPGYQVVDGELPQAPAPPLRKGGLILPGPAAGTVWAPHESGMRLVSLAGRPTDTTIRLPRDAWTASDGGGYVLATTSDGVWWARPGDLTRLSDGTLLAAGATGWLVRECGRGRCANVAIDRRSGTRRTVPGPALPADTGVIAPDGSAAAVFDREGVGTDTVTLLDLATGDRRQVPLRVREAAGGSTFAWSPDSRWLFVANASGQLAFVDGASGEVYGFAESLFAVSLPPIEQLALRVR